MNKFLFFYTALVIFILATSVASEHTFEGTDVKEYNQANIYETGIGLGKNKLKGDYFVMFYAKWCPHCQKFRPIWLDIKKQHEDDNIIAVHCPDNIDLCDTFNITGYPTLLLFTQKDYKYCKFNGVRQFEQVNQFWEDRCKSVQDGEMKEINFRISADTEIKDAEGNTIKQDLEVEVVDSTEKQKQVKRFQQQTNKAYENKMMQMKDYLKKLGPLTIVALMSICIISVAFLFSKFCSQEHGDDSNSKISKKSGKKSKGGYQIARSTDKSSYVL